MKTKTLAIILAIAAFAGFAYANEETPSCCASKTEATEAAATKACCMEKAEQSAETAAAESCCAMESSEATATKATPQVLSDQRGHGQHGRGGHGGGMRGLMQNAHALIFNHDAITRTVEEIPNGVRTVTTTTDPDLLATLRQHPKEMYKHYDQGGTVRHWDPLFVELGRVYDKVEMQFKDVENGIEVTATSDDDEVVKLIRAHAAKVSEFVKRGRNAMHEATPLPEDYTAPKE